MGTAQSRDSKEWRRAHEALTSLAKKRAALDFEEGQLLLTAVRASVHAHLGYSSFAEYVERLFGYRPRSTEEKLRVAEALEELPETAAALESGALSWSAVRELTRVATPQTEGEWVAAAHGRTVRQIEHAVATRKPGDLPSAPATVERKHFLHFEVSPETLATFREAVGKLRRAAGSEVRLDDDTVLLMMAREILGGPADDGRASYQVAVTVCADCGRGFQQAEGELVELSATALEVAKCDAQQIGSVHESAHVGKPSRAHQDVTPAVRRAVLRRDAHRCVVPGCKHHRYVDVHHLCWRSEGGGHDADNLVTLCAGHHTALHRGKLLIEGTPATSLVFRHADGSTYGQPAVPLLADVYAKAFSALCNMSFREAEARSALEKVRGEGLGAEADVSTVVRAALRFLTP